MGLKASVKGSIVLRDESQSDPSARLVASLFEQWNGPICAYLYRLLGDREVALDLAQEVFLRAFRSRAQLRQVDNQRAWLYRVATNVAFDALRRRRRFAWLPWRDVDERHVHQSSAIATSEQRATLEQVLASIAPDYRAPLLLYSYYGFSVREVAEALGISEGAVKTRLYRAREMFRAMYEEGAEE